MLFRSVAHVAGGEFQQWHVIARPRHPFLAAVIDNVLANIETYRPWRHGTGKVGVLNVTGPVAYTRTLAPILSAYPHRRIADESEVGLVYTILGGDAHKTLSGRHYSSYTHSIIRPKGADIATFPAYAAARRLRSLLAGA